MLEELNLQIDFTNREYNVGENFNIVQGGSPYRINILLTNNGMPIVSNESTTYELFVITSDSLDYKKTLEKLSEGETQNGIIELSSEQLSKLSSTKGSCQLIAKVYNSYSIPFNYYVIYNPAYYSK